MSIPDSEQYAHMLDAAATGGYACPAVNVTSSETLNVAVRGFAEAESDGIVEVTTEGAGRRFRSCLDAVVSAGVASACRPSGSRQSL